MIKYNSTRIFDYDSRYQNNRIIYNSDFDADYFEINDNRHIDTTNDNTRYHLVEQTERNRLDIIANIYYGDPTLYWVIAMANNMIDPFIVEPNTILKIPNRESFYDRGSPLAFNG